MQAMDVLFQCYTFNNTSHISNALVKRHLYSTNACCMHRYKLCLKSDFSHTIARDMDKIEETMDSKSLVDSIASASVEKKKAPTNTDSKAPVTVRDFDLNKFSDEETQPYQDEGLNQVVRLMLKAYLPKFY